MEVTWVGHATVLIEAGGTRLITDPLLTRRVAHLRRRRSLPDPGIADVDVVLVSHAHLDHLHLPSLRRLRTGARMLTPRGTARLVRAAGFTDVTEVERGDRIEIGDVTVEVVPAAHSHGRGPHTRLTAPPVGYVVGHGGQRAYFPGDTDLFDEMAELGDIDVALLPIWGWGHTLGGGHLDPDSATTATGLILPRIVLPIHWGTYAPEDGRRRRPLWFDTAPSRFADALARSDLDARLRLVEPGGTVRLS